MLGRRKIASFAEKMRNCLVVSQIIITFVLKDERLINLISLIPKQKTIKT